MAKKPMTPKPQAKPQTSTAPASKKGPTLDDVRNRAHELFLARGGIHGYDVDDWLQAERELLGK